MPSSTEPNECTPSTTSEWEWRKIRRRRPGPSTIAPKAPPGAVLPNWDRRVPLTITVVYRGGPEAWFELRARGRCKRFPGHVAIYDAMEAFYTMLR